MHISLPGAGMNLSQKEGSLYLAVSRAFGNKSLKLPTSLVICTPEVRFRVRVRVRVGVRARVRVKS